MAGTISDTINTGAQQVKNALDKLLGTNSFNIIPLFVLAAAWFFTGDIYLIIFSAIAAVGPAARAESALLPLLVAVLVRRNSRAVSRAALAVAAACYIGIMPTLVDDKSGGQ
nr:nuORF protein [Yanggou tick virus]UVF24403.1 nuORF protein [Yanggou tick virus]